MSAIQFRIPLVDLVAQYEGIREEMDAVIREVLMEGRFIGGNRLQHFAQQFALICETNHCVPVANGTDALEIALLSLGIGRGDEVIIPALSFVATLEAVCNVGATPVFCDIDPSCFTMNTAQAIQLVTDKTKIFMPVHLYGEMTNMDPLLNYAGDHNMFIVEDAAQAVMATYKGQRAGSMGDIATFSFYPGKNLGAYGDAGAIVTNSDWLADKCTKLANHGRVAKYDHDVIGRNSRLDTLQAAVLSVKMNHLVHWTSKRRELVRSYNEKLAGISEIVCPAFDPVRPSVFHLYVIRVPSVKRTSFIHFLKEKSIEAGIHYPVSLNRLRATTHALGIEVHCPEAEKAAAEVVSLPLYPELTEAQQDEVVAAVKQFFGH